MCDSQKHIYFQIILVYLVAPTGLLNLTVTTTGNGVMLSWLPPVSDGGRDDVFYKLNVYKASYEQQLNYYFPCPPITGALFPCTSEQLHIHGHG